MVELVDITQLVEVIPLENRVWPLGREGVLCLPRFHYIWSFHDEYNLENKVVQLLSELSTPLTAYQSPLSLSPSSFPHECLHFRLVVRLIPLGVFSSPSLFARPFLHLSGLVQRASACILFLIYLSNTLTSFQYLSSQVQWLSSEPKAFNRLAVPTYGPAW